MLIYVFIVIILIISAIFHEYAHGWMAYKLGDSTAKDQGRLTLNPIPHLDPIGSILLPMLLIMSKAGFFIGWAKPVPYNPYNLRDAKYGDLKVALAGPATNFFIALFFGLLSRALPMAQSVKYNLFSLFSSGNYDALLEQLQGSFLNSAFLLCLLIALVNLLLMLFNLMPIPPLDGSKIILTFLPHHWKSKYYQIEPYGFVILFVLLFFGFFSVVSILVSLLFSLITGLG